MTRKIVVGTMALGFVIGAFVPALGRSATYVTNDCQHVAQRPHVIVFACGDGNFYAKHLHWNAWHRKKAFGRGDFYYNDCDPDCADGHFHKVRGSLKLRFRRWCSKQHKFVFKHAYIHYNRPVGGRRRQNYGLACPY